MEMHPCRCSSCVAYANALNKELGGMTPQDSMRFLQEEVKLLVMQNANGFNAMNSVLSASTRSEGLTIFSDSNHKLRWIARFLEEISKLQEKIASVFRDKLEVEVGQEFILKIPGLAKTNHQTSKR